MTLNLHGANFLNLPPELITQIIQHCSQSAVVALCSVSRFIRDFGVQSLYRILFFEDPLLFLKCACVLIRNDAVALTVRHFELSFFRGDLLSAFFRVVSRVLPRLNNLRKLKLTVRNSKNIYSSILRTCRFPHLLCLEIPELALTPALSDFLVHHSSTITHLYMATEAPSNLSSDYKPVSPINFPALIDFSGNIALTPCLLQGAGSLRAANFSSLENLLLDQLCIDHAVGHLRSMAGDSIEEIGMITRGFTGPLLSSVVRQLPNITKLVVLHICRENDEARFPTETLFENLKAVLPSLQQLEYLTTVRTKRASAKASCYYQAHTMVTAFGSMCPSLRTIALFDRTQWVRTPHFLKGSWLPNFCFLMTDITDEEELNLTRWLRDMVFLDSATDLIRILNVIARDPHRFTCRLDIVDMDMDIHNWTDTMRARALRMSRAMENARKSEDCTSEDESEESNEDSEGSEDSEDSEDNEDS